MQCIENMAIGADMCDLGPIHTGIGPACFVQVPFRQNTCGWKPLIHRTKDPPHSRVALDTEEARFIANQARHDGDALPLKCARHRTNTYPPIPFQRFGAGRYEDNFGAGFDQRTPQKWKLAVIADEHADFADCCLKELQWPAT